LAALGAAVAASAVTTYVCALRDMSSGRVGVGVAWRGGVWCGGERLVGVRGRGGALARDRCVRG
jgi:hypothetical protein